MTMMGGAALPRGWLQSGVPAVVGFGHDERVMTGSSSGRWDASQRMVLTTDDDVCVEKLQLTHRSEENDRSNGLSRRCTEVVSIATAQADGTRRLFRQYREETRQQRKELELSYDESCVTCIDLDGASFCAYFAASAGVACALGSPH